MRGRARARKKFREIEGISAARDEWDECRPDRFAFETEGGGRGASADARAHTRGWRCVQHTCRIHGPSGIYTSTHLNELTVYQHCSLTDFLRIVGKARTTSTPVKDTRLTRPGRGIVSSDKSFLQTIIIATTFQTFTSEISNRFYTTVLLKLICELICRTRSLCNMFIDRSFPFSSFVNFLWIFYRSNFSSPLQDFRTISSTRKFPRFVRCQF